MAPEARPVNATTRRVFGVGTGSALATAKNPAAVRAGMA
jgi:hypothetical protein